MRISNGGGRRARFLPVCAGLLLGFGPPGSVAAQEAGVYGRVTDATGEALPGVTITVVNAETGLQRTTTTGPDGQYQAPSLPVGAWSVVASLSGFQTVTHEGLRLQVGQQVTLNIGLELAGVEESVTVTAVAPLIESRQADYSTIITEEQVEILPMQNRQWLDLATLSPATSQDAIRGVFYNNVNIGAGVTFYSNGFYVDGVSNNWQQQGEPRQDFPQEGIAEFKVQAFNASADFGFAQGGYLNVVTKSGTNELSGSAFEFFRTKALNSKTELQDEKPDYSRHQFGGSLGGPIVRDKSHFYASVEYTDESSFFTVNTGGAHPAEEGTFERPDWNFMAFGRYDHAINEDHRLFLRYAHQNNELTHRGSGGINAASRAFDFGAPRHSFVLGETWFLSPNTFNDFRVQWAKATYIGWPSGTTKWSDSGEFPAERVDVGPLINRPSLRTGNQSAFLGPERHFQLKNDLTHYRGRHELKVGVSLTWIDWEPDNVGIAEQWWFSSDAPYDPNDPSTHPDRFQQRLLPRFDDFENTEQSVYINDTWTVNDRLTLNLGLRYDWQTGVWNENLLDEPVPEINVRGRVVRPEGLLDPGLFPFYDKSRRGDSDNFGPRLGLVFNPDGDGRQTLRGAYGVFYNRYRANGSPRAERNPEDLLVVIQNPSYPDPYEGQDPFEVARSQRNYSIQGNDNRTPYTRQLSLGWSIQLGNDLSVSLDGIAASGFNQHTRIDFNYPANAADLAAGVRPHAGIGRVTAGITDGEMEYRAFSARVTKRLANRWQLLGSYTMSDVQADSEGFPADHFNRSGDYGHVPADRRHRLTVSGLAMLPGDVNLSGIVRYQSSLPFDVTAGRDLNGDGIGGDRPPGVNLRDGCRDLDLGAVNSYRSANGLAAVNDITCSGFATVDVLASKEFHVGEDSYLEAIFQVFNLLNRANWFPPQGNALSGSFGESTQVAEARQMELALRIRF